MHRFPAEPASFVGRTGELAELERLVTISPLLTIVGVGGCGKTRLAVRLALQLADSFPDGAWFVDLAAVTSPGGAVEAVAAALDITTDASLDAIAVALADKRILLLLDNCEHVVHACASLAESLLGAGPGLRIVATSREPLRASGETVFRLGPLPLPGPGIDADRLEARDNQAVRLFIDRARALERSFDLTPTNAAAIVAICRMVDGIPLAIELAAALMPSFSPAETLALLERALPVLVHGRRAPARHAALRATFAWSHGLLTEDERVLFRRLSVFRGGWSLDAVGPVCASPADGLPRLDRDAIPALLSALTEKSMVVRNTGGEASRYRLLEPLRQYAWELLESAHEREAVQLRHAQYLARVASDLAPGLSSANRSHAIDKIASDVDNFRAALEWTTEPEGGVPTAEQAALGLELVAALFGFWHFHGPRSEGQRWTEAALRQRAGRNDSTAAEALRAAGEFAWLFGEYDLARERLQASIALWRTLGDSQGLAYALQALAPLAGRPDGWTMIRESIDLFARVGDAWGAALACFDVGLLSLQDQDYAGARRHMSDALVRFRALGDHWFAAQVLNDLGDVERSAGDPAQAALRYAEALATLSRVDAAALRPSVVCNLGLVELERNHQRNARRHLREALALFRDRGDRRGIAECLIGLGCVLARMHQPEQAVRLWAAAERLLALAGAELWSTNLGTYARERARVQAKLTPDRFQSHWLEGQASPLEIAVSTVTSGRGPGDGDHAPSSPARAVSAFVLTPREREVAALLARGLSNREIAQALVITEGTAGLHVKNILHKLGCRSRAQVPARLAMAPSADH